MRSGPPGNCKGRPWFPLNVTRLQYRPGLSVVVLCCMRWPPPISVQRGARQCCPAPNYRDCMHAGIHRACGLGKRGKGGGGGRSLYGSRQRSVAGKDSSEFRALELLWRHAQLLRHLVGFGHQVGGCACGSGRDAGVESICDLHSMRKYLRVKP